MPVPLTAIIPMLIAAIILMPITAIVLMSFTAIVLTPLTSIILMPITAIVLVSIGSIVLMPITAIVLMPITAIVLMPLTAIVLMLVTSFILVPLAAIVLMLVTSIILIPLTSIVLVSIVVGVIGVFRRFVATPVAVMAELVAVILPSTAVCLFDMTMKLFQFGVQASKLFLDFSFKMAYVVSNFIQMPVAFLGMAMKTFDLLFDSTAPIV